MASNSQRCAYLCLLSARINSMHHHTQLTRTLTRIPQQYTLPSNLADLKTTISYIWQTFGSTIVSVPKFSRVSLTFLPFQLIRSLLEATTLVLLFCGSQVNVCDSLSSLSVLSKAPDEADQKTTEDSCLWFCWVALENWLSSSGMCWEIGWVPN